MIEDRFEHFQSMQNKRLPYSAKVLREILSSYSFDKENYDHKTYDPFYFWIANEEEALNVLNELGLMFPYQTKLSRKAYYEKYKHQKIGRLPYGYKLAIYFLIENGYAEVVL